MYGELVQVLVFLSLLGVRLKFSFNVNLFNNSNDADYDQADAKIKSN